MNYRPIITAALDVSAAVDKARGILSKAGHNASEAELQALAEMDETIRDVGALVESRATELLTREAYES